MKDKILNFIMIALLLVLAAMILPKALPEHPNSKLREYKPQSEAESSSFVEKSKTSAEPDFAPYMNNIQKDIKAKWNPPKGNESKRVVLLFKVAKDGKLLSVRVFKSSGILEADEAAIKAVKATAPFDPLPNAFKGKSVDIQFTFDYNVFNKTKL